MWYCDTRSEFLFLEKYAMKIECIKSFFSCINILLFFLFFLVLSLCNLRIILLCSTYHFHRILPAPAGNKKKPLTLHLLQALLEIQSQRDRHHPAHDEIRVQEI